VAWVVIFLLFALIILGFPIGFALMVTAGIAMAIQGID